MAITFLAVRSAFKNGDSSIATVVDVNPSVDGTAVAMLTYLSAARTVTTLDDLDANVTWHEIYTPTGTDYPYVHLFAADVPAATLESRIQITLDASAFGLHVVSMYFEGTGLNWDRWSVGDTTFDQWAQTEDTHTFALSADTGAADAEALFAHNNALISAGGGPLGVSFDEGDVTEALDNVQSSASQGRYSLIGAGYVIPGSTSAENITIDMTDSDTDAGMNAYGFAGRLLFAADAVGNDAWAWSG